MSTLTKVLERNIKVIEKNADLTEGRFRLGHHLMPPVGWLNDPNGLCWYKGRYHVFFQYAPFDVEGGLKFWGHYTSEDLVDWKYEGTALYPDSPYDCHGVYSGSALAESEKLHLFFTGNVKIDGDYDYINEGRETSTLHVESEDGIHFGDKEEIISFEKYPEEFTCHIRDPKVWKENDRYFMVLGGRLKGDKGAVLVYESENLKEWKAQGSQIEQTDILFFHRIPELGDTQTTYSSCLLAWNNYLQHMQESRIHETELLNTIASLQVALTEWEKNYLLVSPVNGTVAFMQPWEMNQTVESGETMFVIIPQNATKPIGKALLPMDGIGKVKTGQRAIIRFPAFPEQEFGFIDGTVVSISPVPNQAGFYVLEISLPRNLKTNYGKELPLIKTVKGTASIVTKEKKLLEKLLNLKL